MDEEEYTQYCKRVSKDTHWDRGGAEWFSDSDSQTDTGGEWFSDSEGNDDIDQEEATKMAAAASAISLNECT